MDVLLGRQGFGNRSYFNYKARKKGGKTAECMAKHVMWLAKSEAENKSPQYPEMVLVISVSSTKPGRYWWELCTQRCWWAQWQRQNEGLGRALCRVLNIEFEWPSNESSDVPTPNTHATHTRTHAHTHTHARARTHTHTHLHLQLLASFQCVCNTDPQSTQQSETQQVCWPFWHHSRDAETYWWGKSWADRKTGGGCFQKWYDPSRLEESFILNLYNGKGKALDHGNYHVSSS